MLVGPVHGWKADIRDLNGVMIMRMEGRGLPSKSGNQKLVLNSEFD